MLSLFHLRGCRCRPICAALVVCGLTPLAARANPTRPTVSQGTASFNTSGSTLTVNTSDRAFINWQSFNIGLGETTTFVQPSSSSLVWNRINDPNPSQILGNLNANGYVVLQNQSGFYIGGQASITTHGLLMTTAPIPMPDLSSGGAWRFNAPPPAASIINYGQISAGNGGQAFLIADKIENHGTISAPHGDIGLYAGKQVMVSTRPDGRGLSATLTLPQGSVDNTGKLIADAGTIALNAQVVNQGGLIQANSLREVNGAIELVAGDSLNLGASSVISARGDTAGVSSGGSVTLKSANQFSDERGSVVDVSGGAQGGNGGSLEISAAGMNGLQSTLLGGAAPGWTGGSVTVDPNYVKLVSGAGSSGSGSTAADPLLLGVGMFAGFNQINVQATQNLELATLWSLLDSAVPATVTLQSGGNLAVDSGSGISAGLNWALNITAGSDFATPNSTLPGVGTLTLSGANPFSTSGAAINLAAGQDINLSGAWTLGANASGPATLSLTAGRNITFASTASMRAGNNWGVNLTAGPQNLTGPQNLAAGTDGVYLNGASVIQTQNGNINVWAANEVVVNTGAIRTMNGLLNPATPGGNISVTAQYGSVNAGTGTAGYVFSPVALNVPPYYYSVSPNLSGISTAAGGNVTITALNGNVSSYLPTQAAYNRNVTGDAGTGAFGYQPGNVTITAGGTISGHYVLADGVGTITSQNGNIGAPLTKPAGDFDLSLIKGSWSVNAPNGYIYLREVRNPNGMNNDSPSYSTYLGYHRFDYDPLASVTLNAGNFVEITGGGPRPTSESPPMPMIFPPSLDIIAGSGGFNLDAGLIMYPSPYGNLTITTTGQGGIQGNNNYLEMSDSAHQQWTQGNFSDNDRGPVPIELPNFTIVNGQEISVPVTISVGGSVNNLTLYTTKETVMTVGGDMNNSSLLAQNLRASDVSSVTVGGNIYYTPALNFANLGGPIQSANPLQPGVWDSVFVLAVDPSVTSLDTRTVGDLAQTLKNKYLLFPASQSAGLGRDPGFVYDSKTYQLGVNGNMQKLLTPKQLSALESGSFTVLKVDADGNPLVDANGHLETTTYQFYVPVNQNDNPIVDLYNASLVVPQTPTPGFQIGGPGQFNIKASSIQLGNSQGILSWGPGYGDQVSGVNYSYLAPFTPSGAAITVTTSGELSALTSRIASVYGGDVDVESTAGGIDLGSQNFFITSSTPAAYGIYSSGHGDVKVTAYDDVNIDGSRIAAYNGGDVSVESYHGNVNAGSGGNFYVNVPLVSVDPASGAVNTLADPIYGSGIVATSLPANLQTPGGNPLPGNITVQTPQGNITSDLAGILQLALDGNVTGGPTVTLTAGTPAVAASPGVPATPAIPGNVDLGDSGLIGGTVNVTAQGNIQGLIVSRQNSDIHATQNFSGTLLSAGTANVQAGGNVSGTVVGITGANVSGGGVNSANVLSQNASINGAAASSTFTSATPTSASQNAAATSSDNNEKQTAMDTTPSDDDLKKKKPLPLLVRLISRVTVILPK